MCLTFFQRPQLWTVERANGIALRMSLIHLLRAAVVTLMMSIYLSLIPSSCLTCTYWQGLPYNCRPHGSRSSNSVSFLLDDHQLFRFCHLFEHFLPQVMRRPLNFGFQDLDGADISVRVHSLHPSVNALPSASERFPGHQSRPTHCLPLQLPVSDPF